MLISFSVENFRSIRDRQTLSMVRASNGATSRLAIDGPLAGGTISPISVIFGANASGKSTVREALNYVQWIVRTSARREAGRPLPMDPFLLDNASRARPFFTEVQFTVADVEYCYSFSLVEGLVASEDLKQVVIGPLKHATRTLFSRTMREDGTTDIVPSRWLTGSKKAIIDATRSNSLFLSKAAQENYEPLREVYEWFVQPKASSDSEAFGETDASVAQFESDPEFPSWVVRFLKQADLGITDVTVKMPTSKPPAELVAFLAKTITEADNPSVVADPNAPIILADAEARIMKSNRRPVLTHRAGSGNSSELPWSLESQGTQNLWELLGPIYHALKCGRLLSIDELKGLHPLLVRAVLEIFQSAETNPNNAQLLFTSHDISLLGSWGGLGYMLDRDQVWFTEKDYYSGVTELVPLTNFRPRKDEDIERAYIQGRLGGVPSVGRLIQVHGGEGGT